MQVDYAVNNFAVAKKKRSEKTVNRNILTKIANSSFSLLFFFARNPEIKLPTTFRSLILFFIASTINQSSISLNGPQSVFILLFFVCILPPLFFFYFQGKHLEFKGPFLLFLVAFFCLYPVHTFNYRIIFDLI